jgi:phosphoserine phosphatase RsbU/P
MDLPEPHPPAEHSHDAGAADVHTMQCMEVFGGNVAIERRVAVLGLDAWVYSRPFRDKGVRGAGAGGVGGGGGGGDIHYLTTCATERITRLMLADVSGHGRAVAEVATTLRRLLGKYSNYVDQSRFVGEVNTRFGEIAGSDESFAGLFATAVVATFFSPTGELSVVNAGHPRPMVYSARSRAWSVVDGEDQGEGPANLPLGVLEETRYTAAVVGLEPGDLALVYTDSLIEAREPGGRMLGEAGLLRVLNEVGGEPAATLISRLLGAVAAVTRGEPSAGAAAPNDADLDRFNDDVSVLLVRPDGRAPRPSPVLSVLATARMVRRAVSAALGGDLPASLPELSVRNIGGASIFGLNKVGAKRPPGPDGAGPRAG